MPNTPNHTPLHLEQINVTQYKNAFDTTGFSITLRECLQSIRSEPSLKAWMEYLRPLYRKSEQTKADVDIKAYAEAKKNLTAFMFSGTFTHRAKTGLQHYTGIIQCDLDHLQEKGFDIRELKNRISHDPHVLFYFISPSGDGLKIGIRVATGPEDHVNAFLAMQRYFEATYGIRPDDQCKDVSRLCFFSSDPEIHINEKAIPFEWEAWQDTEQTHPESNPGTTQFQVPSPNAKASLDASIVAHADAFIFELFGNSAKKVGAGQWRVGNKNSLAISVKEHRLEFFSHEECVGGDALALWHRVRGGSKKEAERQIKAWLFGAANGQAIENPTGFPKSDDIPHREHPDWSRNWSECVGRATDEFLNVVAKWRGLPIGILRYLRSHGLIGCFNSPNGDDCPAFPVHDGRGVIVSCHYRTPDGSWRYEPKGCGTHPLLIGNPNHSTFWVFESQWDAFAVLAALGYEEYSVEFQKLFAVIITRGAGNGHHVSRVANHCKRLVLWAQNDPPNPTSGIIPSQQWVKDIATKFASNVVVKRVFTPSGFEDPAAWCKGAKPGQKEILTAVDIANAIVSNTESDENIESLRDAGILERLHSVAFDVNNPPPDEPMVMSVAGVSVCHPGNITVIEAAQKAGKSAFVSAGLGRIMSRTEGDFLGWGSDGNPKNFAVLHFDCEQSKGDHYSLVCRALKRSTIASAPPWLQSFCLTGWGYADLKKAISAAIADARMRFGGIHSVWIDGYADCVRSPNDEQEAIALVAWLQDQAITRSFPIVGILHLNPGDSGKSRGHLGSELNRKAETVLRITKAGERSTVKTQWARHAPIPSGCEPRFEWSDKEKRHVTVSPETINTEREEDLNELRNLVRAVWGSDLSAVLKYMDVVSRIREQTKQSESDAKRKLNLFVKKTLVKRLPEKQGYKLNAEVSDLQ
jgi:hypothetical protein